MLTRQEIKHGESSGSFGVQGIKKIVQKQARKAYVRSLEQMRELFRRNDVARAERFKEGDKWVYDEL